MGAVKELGLVLAKSGNFSRTMLLVQKKAPPVPVVIHLKE